MKRRYVAFTVIGVFILLVLLSVYGYPKQVQFTATPPFVILVWDTQQNEEAINQPIIPTTEPIVREIKIISLEPTQKIYEPNSNATVKFEIKNSLGVPYNITVNWFHNNTRKFSWFNYSTEIHNVTKEDNTYEAWYSPVNEGEWEVQLLIRYEYRNYTFPLESVTNFRVI